MMSIIYVFWMYVLLFAVIGGMRGWAKELLVSNGGSLDQWFDKKAINTLLEEHRIGRVDHGKRIYALTMLALWRKGQ